MSAPLNSYFNSISPSAKSLLLNKSLTTIPFAKEAVELMWGEKSLQHVYEKLTSYQFILKCIHFETRYLSIDEALSVINLKNILEFSSGYSFRGLSKCSNPEIFYIDTDLPQIQEIKKKLIEELYNKYCTYAINNLRFTSREFNIQKDLIVNYPNF